MLNKSPTEKVKNFIVRLKKNVLNTNTSVYKKCIKIIIKKTIKKNYSNSLLIKRLCFVLIGKIGNTKLILANQGYATAVNIPF
jgi:hypothetical protein